MQEYSGLLDAQGLRFGLVVSRFNSRVSDALLAGALDTLRRLSAEEANLTVVRVPGSFEIPQALRALASGSSSQASRPDALIALGSLIRGETAHFDHLAAVVTRALDTISAESGIPVANGVLTCDTFDQALERSGGKAGNKGAEAAMTAVEMARLLAEIGGLENEGR